MADNGSNGNNGSDRIYSMREFDQDAANGALQGNRINGNGNGRLDGDLEAGAPDSSRQSQAGSTPPPNAQQARQEDVGREAGTRTENRRSGVSGLVGRLFGGVRKSLEALPLPAQVLQEANAGAAGGQEEVVRAGRQEEVVRAAGGRVGGYGVRQQAQEEQKEDKISNWLRASNDRFRSSRTPFGSNQSESLVATEVGQASVPAVNVGVTVPATDPSAGGLAEHAFLMSPFPSPPQSPRTQG